MSLFSELIKRKVLTTGAIYIPAAWLAAEILIFLADRLGAPQWVGNTVAVLFILGFPVALLLSWLFDVSADGVRRASPGSIPGLAALLVAGLFLSGGAYFSYTIFTGRLSEVSVAVLPLRTNSAEPDAELYGLGIADSLRSSLQQIPVLRVPARTSSEAVVRSGLDIPGIASRLDVEYVVEGTLDLVGQRMIVSISLISAGGRVHWSDRFEGATRNLFELQDELVRTVALRLGIDEHDADLQKNLRKPAATQNMEAHRLYLRGKYADVVPGKRMSESNGMAALKQARQLDPGYAAVHSAMAFLYGFDCWMGVDRFSPECELTINHATRAVEIDPGEADALNSLALVHSLRYEFHESQAAIDRFLELGNPALNSSSLPWAYLNLGRLQLAWDSAQAYYRSDPLNVFSVANMVLWAAVLKKDDAMAQFYEEILVELLGFSILSGYPSTRVHRLDMQTALQDMQGVLPVWGISPDVAPQFAEIWVRPIYEPSFRETAVQSLHALHEANAIPFHDYWEGLMVLHETDRAMELAFETFDRGELNPAFFWLDFPGEKAFRNHPRFMELVERIGLASYWDDVGWPPFCERRGDAQFCGLDFAVK
jgi:TolB-like protein